MTDWNKIIERNKKYIKTKDNFIKHNDDIKLQKLGITENLEKLYQPITKGQEQISKDLKGITNIQEQNNKLLALTNGKEEEPKKYVLLDGRELSKTWQVWFNQDNGKFTINNSEFTLNDQKEFVTSNGVNTKIVLTDDIQDLIYGDNDFKNYTKQQLEDYLDLMVISNSSKSAARYKNIIKVLKTFEGSALASAYLNKDNVVVIPDNPDQLLKRLEILIAACKEGHNNNFNEINAILKQLMKKNIISKSDYKRCMDMANF